MATISICAIIKNESARIERFVDHNLKWCNEIVLVDTGSTDDTLHKIADRPVKLFHRPINDDFSAARNLGISKAASDWIFALDTDELVDECYHSRLLELIETTENEAIVLPWITIQGSTVTPDYKVVLFKNHKQIQFDGIVHEQIVKSLRTNNYSARTLDIPIYHYPSATSNKAKKDFYRRLLEIELASGPTNPRTNFFLAIDALKNRGDLQSALKYHTNGARGGIQGCPIEFIQNALSAARLLRATSPKAAMEMLRKVLELKHEIENDPASVASKYALFGIEAMYFDLTVNQSQAKGVGSHSSIPVGGAK